MNTHTIFSRAFATLTLFCLPVFALAATEQSTDDNYASFLGGEGISVTGKSFVNADFNADGFADLMMLRGSTFSFYNGSTSQFPEETTVPDDADANITVAYGYNPAVGDVNNDGFLDYIVGTYFSDSIYVFFGSQAGFSGALTTNDADIVYTTNSEDSNFGSYVVVQDFDGDGIDDLLAGAESDDSVINDGGVVYVMYGPLTTGEYVVESAADATIVSTVERDLFGYNLRSAGDVNDDGIADLVVNRDRLNHVSLIYGSETRLSGQNNISSVESDNIPNPGDGEIDDYQYPYPIGDVNYDGYDDIAITFKADENEPGHFIHVYYGSEDGFSGKTTPDTILSMDGEPMHNIAGLGDVNGDTIDDFVFGIRTVDDYTGRAFIVLGGVDNLNATYDLNSVSSNSRFIEISGEDIDAEFGAFVSAAGDVNGDGVNEALIASGEEAGVPALYVRYGERTASVPTVGEIASAEKQNGSILLTYENGSIETIQPYNGRKKFRLALSTDSERLVVTNGKNVKVFRDGTKVSQTKINKKTPKKKKHFQLKISEVYSGYDTIAVATARKRKGKLSVMRLVDSDSLNKKKADSISIRKKNVKLRVRTGKKKIRVKWGRKTQFWKLKSSGKLKKL